MEIDSRVSICINYFSGGSMKAREALIRAYAFYTLKPDGAGDGDLGAKGGASIRRARTKRGPHWAVDPQKATQSKAKSINTNSIVCNALTAGKIISAAEGKDSKSGAYARIYYSDSPLKTDYTVLYGYLAGVCLNRLRGKIEDLRHADSLIRCFAQCVKPDHDQIVSNEKVYDILETLINGLDKSCLIRVGNWLSIDNGAEKQA